MMHAKHKAFEHPEVQLAGYGYGAAYGASMALMALSLLLVKNSVLSPLGLGVTISAIAAVAAIMQCVLLLHMNVSDTQVWHTVALVLFIPLFILTIGLTSWMFHGLYQRTMMRPVVHLRPVAAPAVIETIKPR